MKDLKPGSGLFTGADIATTVKYRLKREIATGGMGAIYEGVQYGAEGFVKRVAVKILHPELSDNQRFVSMLIGEAELASGLVHQNIVQIYHLGKSNGGYFITMEYIDGVDLEVFIGTHLRNDKWVPVELVVYIISRICRGLEYAHTVRDETGTPMNIVHRDVSPRNVLITNEGEVKLGDFGVAKAAKFVPEKMRDNMMVGKVPYMSPELATYSPTDCRSDIFSLGAVFYDLLTGVRIFEKDTEEASLEEILNGSTTDPREYRADIPEDVVQILMKCLERDPDARYQTAGEMGYALEYHMYSGGFGPTIMTLAKYAAEVFPTHRFYVAPSRGDSLVRAWSESVSGISPEAPSL